LNILVVRLSSLGDVILTTPALAALKEKWPAARLAVLTKRRFADVFLGHPAVDETLIFEDRGLWGWAGAIRRRRFDLYVDLHDTPRSRLWGWLSGSPRRVRLDKQAAARQRLVRTKRPSPALASPVKQRYMDALRPLGIAETAGRPALFVPRAASLSPELARRLGEGPFIGVAPGAAHATKRWPAERFAAAADALAEKLGAKIIFLGAPSDEGVAREALGVVRAPAQNFVGRTDVKELVLLIARCRLLLTNDSGAMHAASALGVPTVAVFGPTVEAFGFFPEKDTAAVLERPGLYCRPCTLHGGPRCPEGHFRCMTETSVEEAVRAAERFLGSIGPSAVGTTPSPDPSPACGRGT